ncbi:MAG: D-alanine--D-alanine ligase [Bdellovibrionales bacterium]|nr:D-alanine--D-alanine ligase [Bdellovibrionales bacterium]
MNASRKKVAILFGGKSGEHEISIISALSVFSSLDKNKYQAVLIGIDKKGRWVLPQSDKILSLKDSPREIFLENESNTLGVAPFSSNQPFFLKNNNPALQATLNNIEVLFPVLHGTQGEDGTMQGLLELIDLPYVGSGVLGSALGMDKDISRQLLKSAGIPCVPTKVIYHDEFSSHPIQVIDLLVKDFGFPVFIKPANSGSSVGVHKIKNKAEYQKKLSNSFLYDYKVLVEKAIVAREIECSVLGNSNPQASPLGEIVPQHEFYSYEAKYLDENGAKLIVPVMDLEPEIITKIKNYALQAFQLLQCSGLARVDFFLDKNSNEIYLNEINTLPGFTKISMYPKLWEVAGLTYPDLLDRLIQLAYERHQMKSALKTTYQPNT